MTSVPHPCFLNKSPVDVDAGCLALSAVGKCRIYPETCKEGSADQYRKIVSKNTEQAQVNIDNAVDHADKDSKKKLKKKYMKEGVAMAKTFLGEFLGLDVSIVDVEIFVESKDILDTDGCLASCLLDAGCHAIITDGMNLKALDAAKLPRERVGAHFALQSSPNKMKEAVLPAVSLAKYITFDNLSSLDDVSQTMSSLDTEELDIKVNFQINNEIYGKFGSDDELASSVGEISNKSFKDENGNISFVDPSAKQLGLTYAACMRTDRQDGLYTTVVCTRSGEALGLVYSSKESVVAALECGRGVYYSRSRGGLWRKGDTSGHYQTLHRLDVDCDGDALRFTVTQRGDDVAAFCHLNTLTCWGEPRGIRHLEGTLKERLKSAPEGSYTKRLFDDEELLRDKLVEEAQELSEADTQQHVAEELADVMYFAMVRAAKAGVSIDDAVAELDRRSRKVTRRKGDSKAFRIEAGNEILNKK